MRRQRDEAVDLLVLGPAAEREDERPLEEPGASKREAAARQRSACSCPLPITGRPRPPERDAEALQHGRGEARHGGDARRAPRQEGVERPVGEAEGRRVAVGLQEHVGVVQAEDLPAVGERAEVGEVDEAAARDGGQHGLLPGVAAGRRVRRTAMAR